MEYIDRDYKFSLAKEDKRERVRDSIIGQRNRENMIFIVQRGREIVFSFR